MAILLPGLGAFAGLHPTPVPRRTRAEITRQGQAGFRGLGVFRNSGGRVAQKAGSIAAPMFANEQSPGSCHASSQTFPRLTHFAEPVPGKPETLLGCSSCSS